MSIERVFDKRIKDARIKLRDTQSAYKQAIRERDELIIKLHSSGEYSIEGLSRFFQVKEDKIKALISK